MELRHPKCLAEALRLMDRVLETNACAQSFPVGDDNVCGLGDKYAGKDEIMTSKAEGRHADGEGGNRRQSHGNRPGQPRGKAVDGEEIGRRVGTNSVVNTVPDRNLARVAAEDVPGSA